MIRMSLLAACLAIVALVVGCSRESAPAAADAAADSVTAVAFNVEGAPTVEFNVPDMMCPESCAVKTKEILSQQPGVKDVVVDFDAKTATVAIEPAKFSADAAIAALVDYGFDHSTLKSADTKAETSPATTAQPAG
jgi:copper chaperone CopZ